MSEGTEQDLARAMIRLYGSDAESVAAGHAETHADMGDKSKSDNSKKKIKFAYFRMKRITLRTVVIVYRITNG